MPSFPINRSLPEGGEFPDRRSRPERQRGAAAQFLYPDPRGRADAKSSVTAHERFFRHDPGSF